MRLNRIYIPAEYTREAKKEQRQKTTKKSNSSSLNLIDFLWPASLLCFPFPPRARSLSHLNALRIWNFIENENHIPSVVQPRWSLSVMLFVCESHICTKIPRAFIMNKFCLTSTSLSFHVHPPTHLHQCALIAREKAHWKVADKSGRTPANRPVSGKFSHTVSARLGWNTERSEPVPSFSNPTFQPERKKFFCVGGNSELKVELLCSCRKQNSE